MSEHDKNLIEKACNMAPCDWMVVGRMVDEAESEESKSKLKTISSRLYHKEEYDAGIL